MIKKEILDFLDNDNKERPFGISNHDLKILRDYITNLQNKYENQIHRYMNLKEYTTNLQQENEDYKSRCEKAIEYIEDNTYKSYETDYMDLTGIKELLNILNGGDEE